LAERRVETLSSEPTAEHCHRRIVLEYFRQKWAHLEITHLQDAPGAY
jgi:hypothetical protein